MKRKKSNYYLTKVGKIFYYYTYDAFGRRTTKKSTGLTNRAEADLYCQDLFKKDALKSDSSMKLSQYISSKSFFEVGKCRYSLFKGVTEVYTKDCYSRMKVHILPTLGELSFNELNKGIIKYWQEQLVLEKGLAIKTVRQVTSVLKIILDQATIDGLLFVNPVTGQSMLPKNNSRTRGILQHSEAFDLFNKDKIEEHWKGQIHYYTASLVACYTGMRQGEIIALTPDKIKGNKILVSQSYSIKTKRLGPTKTKENRTVYMIKEVKDALEAIMPESGFIFSLNNGQSPLTSNRLTDAFYSAIERMGIDRKARNITFHSFRHGVVTHLRSKGLSDAKIYMVTGQKSSRVIDDYTRFNLMDDEDVIEAMDTLSSPAVDLKHHKAIEALKQLGTAEAKKAISLLTNKDNNGQSALTV